jgi:4-hydroxybenzoate polyprenyltransferase
LISEFLAGNGSPRASVSLELLPQFRVNLSRDGVLFPNPGACLPEIDRDESQVVVPVNTPPAHATERDVPPSRMAIAIDLLKSSRPANVLMALTLASVSYAANSKAVSFASYAMLLLSVAFAVSGSFIVNDVADRSIDRINNPKRPVAAGTVTPRLALVVGAALLSVAPLFARLVSPSLAILCLVVCVASAFYSFYLKSRNGISANVLSALLTATLCFVGFDIANPSWPMVGISIAVFFAALAREIAKDVEDLPGDRLFRKSTLAITTGTSTATKTAIVVAGVQILASYIPYALGGAGSVYFVGITIANIILLRALSRAFKENAAGVVQKAVKLSMALYLITYVALLSPMGAL